MSARDAALDALRALPGDASWDEVVRAVVARAPRSGRVREIGAAYGVELPDPDFGIDPPPARSPAPSTERTREEPMGYAARITLEPGKRSGRPCVRGLRITVGDVLGYMASGMSDDEILADFPELERDDLRACLAFAADRERRIRSAP